MAEVAPNVDPAQSMDRIATQLGIIVGIDPSIGDYLIEMQTFQVEDCHWCIPGTPNITIPSNALMKFLGSHIDDLGVDPPRPLLEQDTEYKNAVQKLHEIQNEVCPIIEGINDLVNQDCNILDQTPDGIMKSKFELVLFESHERNLDVAKRLADLSTELALSLEFEPYQTGTWDEQRSFLMRMQNMFCEDCIAFSKFWGEPPAGCDWVQPYASVLRLLRCLKDFQVLLADLEGLQMRLEMSVVEGGADVLQELVLFMSGVRAAPGKFPDLERRTLVQFGEFYPELALANSTMTGEEENALAKSTMTSEEEHAIALFDAVMRVYLTDQELPQELR